MTKLNPAQIQKYLGGIDYPCSKQDIVSHAEDEGADDATLQALNSLPMDSFNSPNDISEAIGRMK